MTSEERHQARYLRRVAARQQKKQSKYSQADNFERVFTFENLYAAYKECRKGVSWKASVQKYIARAPYNVMATREKLLDGTFRSPGFYEFDIFERGKKRHIRSTVISERVVQRCLCDNALVPLLTRTFVYDNGASMKDKGYDFAIDRLVEHLRQHYREHGQEGYILLFDFSKFFDRISHALIKGILHAEITDRKLLALTEHFVDAFGEIGLGLGSQISQVLALASGNRLDHFIKEVLRIGRSARYMDDGYLIHVSKEVLQKCLAAIRALCDELGIVLNEKKTQIVKLSHGFTWLKARVYLTESGEIIKKIYKRSIVKARQKLKKLKTFYENGEMTFQDVYQSWQSWAKGYARRFKSYKTVKRMAQLFNDLFIFTKGDNLCYTPRSPLPMAA